MSTISAAAGLTSKLSDTALQNMSGIDASNRIDTWLDQAKSPVEQGNALRVLDALNLTSDRAAASPGERGVIHFDGRTFTVFTAGRTEPSLQINAVSGRPGHQTSAHQGETDRGPIPEGRYLVSQRRAQQITASDDALGRFGRGGWPGGIPSWGFQRIWLTPMEGTNVRGRSGFSIHGGDTPGSAGCVDLTTRMGDFFRFFRNANTDFVLIVDYGQRQ
jgi:hypothetical protein